MSEQKGLGSKLKRLFIEEGEGAGPASAAEEIAALAEESAPPGAAAAKAAAVGAPGAPTTHAAAPAAPPVAGQAPPVEPAKVDFASIFRAAGLTEDDLSQVDKAEKLLKTLPAALPLETQKQILEGTLKTFGVDPARIRQTLGRQQHALSSYVTVVRQDADKRDAEARARIESLRAEALKLERAIEDRARQRAGVELSCKTQGEASGRLGDYLPAPASAKETT